MSYNGVSGSEITTINSEIESSGGTSADIHRRLQQQAMQNKILENYVIDTIDLDEDEFANVLNESGLKGAIATNKYGAQTGDFVTLNTDYWTDNPLMFEKDDSTGSYKVLQQDENGTWVAMGWTTEEVALDYMYMTNKLNKGDTGVYTTTSTSVGSNNSASQSTTDNTGGKKIYIAETQFAGGSSIPVNPGQKLYFSDGIQAPISDSGYWNYDPNTNTYTATVNGEVKNISVEDMQNAYLLDNTQTNDTSANSANNDSNVQSSNDNTGGKKIYIAETQFAGGSSIPVNPGQKLYFSDGIQAPISDSGYWNYDPNTNTYTATVNGEVKNISVEDMQNAYLLDNTQTNDTSANSGSNNSASQSTTDNVAENSDGSSTPQQETGTLNTGEQSANTNNNSGTLLKEYEILNNGTTTIDIDEGFGLYKADGTPIPTPKGEITVNQGLANDTYLVNGVIVSKEEYDGLYIKELEFSLK